MCLNQDKYDALLYLHKYRKSFDDEQFKTVYEALIDLVAKWNHSIIVPHPEYKVTEEDRRTVKRMLNSHLKLIGKRDISEYREKIFSITKKIEKGVDLFLEDI